MIVSSLTVGPFEENTYLLIDNATRKAVLIDPGDEGERILREVKAVDAKLDAIWLTHAHIDHIGGIAAVLREWPVPVHMHPLDQRLFDDGQAHAADYGVPFEQPPAPDRELAEGGIVQVGALRFDVMHLPGHAPGHVAFHGYGALFSGDVLFAGSIGRTDLPFANPSHLEQSLARLATLPPDTHVYAGHGPSTTIGAELRSNPFLTGAARISGAARR
jgi:glyoxylase-like metal-dependent hydrolase (beta-lactamase superfamily II)